MTLDEFRKEWGLPLKNYFKDQFAKVFARKQEACKDYLIIFRFLASHISFGTHLVPLAGDARRQLGLKMNGEAMVGLLDGKLRRSLRTSQNVLVQTFLQMGGTEQVHPWMIIKIANGHLSQESIPPGGGGACQYDNPV